MDALIPASADSEVAVADGPAKGEAPLFYRQRPAPPEVYRLRRLVQEGHTWAYIAEQMGGVTIQAVRARAINFGLVKKPVAGKTLTKERNADGHWVVGGKARVPVDVTGITDETMLTRMTRYNAWCEQPDVLLGTVAAELDIKMNELCRIVGKVREQPTYVPKPGTPRPNRRRKADVQSADLT